MTTDRMHIGGPPAPSASRSGRRSPARTPLLLTALLALGGLSPALAQRAVEETVATAPTGEVEVVNASGSVRVRGWDRGEIRVTGALGEGAERVAIQEASGRTQVRVVGPTRGRNVRGSDIEVWLPAGKRVVVRTVSADVEAGALSGALAVTTTSGDVEISGSPAQVTASSTSGDLALVLGTATRVQANTTSGDVVVSGTVRESVDVESVSGEVEVSATTPEIRARTVSGDLQIGGAGERVAASTVSGDAEIRDSRIRYGSFETVSGNLVFDGALQRGAAFNIQSHSGEVELLLPGDVAAEFEVNTFSGSIRSDFQGSAPGAVRGRSRREMRATVGGGGALVTVRTFSGDVHLIRR